MRSESIENLAKALVAAQAELTNPTRSANNPYFKSKYTPLDQIIEETKPILNRHGLAISQMLSGLHLTTVLVHESGEFWGSTMELLLDKGNMQGLGSAVTYGRRYMWAALCGIASDSDDDANHASGTDSAGGNFDDFDL